MNRELPRRANAVAFAGCIVLALLSLSMISPEQAGKRPATTRHRASAITALLRDL